MTQAYNMPSIFIDEDECSLGKELCSNGGVCINSLGSYSCDCTGTGYTGTNCTTGNIEKYFHNKKVKQLAF